MVYVINLLFIDKFVILIRTINNVSGCLAVVKRELSEALVVAAQSGGDNPLHPFLLHKTDSPSGRSASLGLSSVYTVKSGWGGSLPQCLSSGHGQHETCGLTPIGLHSQGGHNSQSF